MGPMGSICPAHPDQCGGKCCGSSCAEIMFDVKNCGDCGKTCGTGQVCAGGACGCPPSGAACGQGQSCCGAAGCKSLMSDVNNCGTCGHACNTNAGESCTSGMCTCGGTLCKSGENCCSGACSSTCTPPPPPDMAMPPGQDGGSAGGLCQCASHCPLSMLCVGPNCCFEDAFLGTCTPALTCSPNSSP